jgi:hypothetical protein
MEHQANEFRSHAYTAHKSNQRSDHPVCSLRQTSRTPEAFSAPTLRAGAGANQSVGHLNLIEKKPERELRFPLNNYLFMS